MGTLILTGPSAAGKNAVAAAIAELRERAAIVDADVVRQLAVRPGRLPAAVGESAGEHDWPASVRAAAALANTFVADGFDVILVDVLTEASAALYRDLLADAPRIAQLLPAYEEVLRRHRLRGDDAASAPSEPELERLYGQQEALSSYDVRLDNTSLAPEEAADQLNGWL